jgi:hypothetical protein
MMDRVAADCEVDEGLQFYLVKLVIVALANKNMSKARDTLPLWRYLYRDYLRKTVGKRA